MFFYNFFNFFNFFFDFLIFFSFFATTIPLGSFPGPSPKTHEIILRVAVEGADLIIIITVNNAVLKTKDGRIIHCPPSPNRNLDIWSQFLSGEFDSAWVGKLFTDGTVPAAAALHGTGKRGPGHFFFGTEYLGTRNRTRVVVNRAGTRAFDYPSHPYYIVILKKWFL